MTPRRWAALLVVVVVAYVVLIGVRCVQLIATGDPVAIGLAVAVLVVPVVAVGLVWREVRFGFRVQAMGRALDAERGLPVDDLPRTPSGRVELAAADAVFAQRQAEVDAAPQDWRTWFRLAVAYDDARDRRRARAAMREAIARYPVHSAG
ncbi:MAG: hypothetical protein EPO13_05740 [Actinomycetota bacterium]|nr:MAG: hypothetical protein EPO13_05740 [Actinomycetota bacterium]